MPHFADMGRACVDPRVIVPVLMLIFAAITASHVFTEPLWGDDLRTWRDGIEKPLGDVLLWRHNADHAPLGHLLARLGAATFGVEHAWALRLGSWLCGLACVPAVWWMGRTVGGSNAVGLLMAVMLVVDPNVEKAATTARMYSLLLLAGTLSIGFAASLLMDPRRPAARMLGLATALAVGLWSHSQIYAVLAPLLLLSIALLAVGLKRRQGVDRSAAAILMSIGAALAVGCLGVLKLVSRRDADPLDPELARRPFAQLEDATRALSGENWITALVLIFAIVGHVLVAKTRRPAVAMLLGGVVVMSMVNLLIAARYRSVEYPRYLTIAQPALWAGIAVTVRAIVSGMRSGPTGAGVGVAALIGWTGLCGYQLSRALADAPHPAAAMFRDAMRTIGEDERVLFVPRSPHAMYGRHYGKRHDEAAFDAIAAHVSTRRERGRRPAPTTRQSAFVSGNEPVTIVGMIPARDNKARTAEDPLVLIQTLARARGISPPAVPTPDGTQRVIVVRFTADGRIEVDDPRRPATGEKTAP